jgi:hypothetical protein
MDIADSYNGKEIWKMLLDDRSIHRYPRGVFGKRIIEGKRCEKYFYDPKSMEILLTAPVSKKEYIFALRFNNRELWQELKNHLYNNPDCVVVVAGDWEKSGISNRFRSAVSNKKQIYTNAKR